MRIAVWLGTAAMVAVLAGELSAQQPTIPKPTIPKPAMPKPSTPAAAAAKLVVAFFPQRTAETIAAAAQAPGTGTIKGRIKLNGPIPANPMIRLGVDPMCSRANAGRRLTQQIVVAGADGGLANVVVQLAGDLPAGTPPADPVVINQKGCVYSPRVVTAQPGQTLRVINSDTMLHEVHTTNTRANEFKVTQPQSGMVFNQKLKKDTVVMRLACTVHSWMAAHVAVIPHAFAAVTDDSGTFTIARVPAGKYTIQTWHERYGKLSKTVDVTAGGTVTINFDYTGKEKPQTVAGRDIVRPGDAQSIPTSARSSAQLH